MILQPIIAKDFIENFGEEKSIIVNGMCFFPCNEVFLKSWNERANILLLYGSYGCFTKTQNIRTINGSIPIFNIKKGDLVLSHNEYLKINEFKEVINTFKYDFNDEIIQVTLQNGKVIEATKEHKFYFGTKWENLNYIVSLCKNKNANYLEKNTKLQPLRSFKYRRYKNIQLERIWANKNNETSERQKWIFKNNAKKRRWSYTYNKSSQNNLYDFSRYGERSFNSTPQKSYKNRQPNRKFKMAKSRRQLQGFICRREVLHTFGSATSLLQNNGKTGFRNKGKIQTKNIYKENVSNGVWLKRKPYKKNSKPSVLELVDIKSWCYKKLHDFVYDIEVEDNHNYFLDCGKNILVHNSGKSVFTVEKLLNHLLNDDYFRLYYGRKVHDTIRASCFDTICDTIEDLGIEKLFNYKRSSNSSMEITAKGNSNFMRTFTIDDPSKAKSIKDPSHIWMEEADQFTDKDFGLLLSRLRTKKVKNTQLILTTNTERMHNNHWIVTQILNNSIKI